MQAMQEAVLQRSQSFLLKQKFGNCPPKATMGNRITKFSLRFIASSFEDLLTKKGWVYNNI